MSFLVIKSTILLSILVLLFIEIEAKNQLDITSSFVIISLMTTLRKPLTSLNEYLFESYRFRIANNTLNFFLFYIEDNPLSLSLNIRFKAGTLKYSGVTAKVKNGVDMLGVINSIYNGYGFRKNVNSHQAAPEEIVCQDVSLDIEPHKKYLIWARRDQNLTQFIYTLMG